MSNLQQASQFFSLLSTAIYGGFLAYKKWRVWKKKENEIFSVLTSRKGGLSTALEHLDDYDRERVVLLDEQKVIESQDEETKKKMEKLRDKNKEAFCVKLLPMFKEYLDEMKAIYRNTVFIIFTSNYKLVEYLKIKPKRRLIVLPSLKMLNVMIKTLKEDETEQLMNSRELLQSLPQEKTYYNTYSQLKDVIDKMVSI